jgi:hypothetical protein
LKLTSNAIGSIRFHIERIDMAWSSILMEEDNAFGSRFASAILIRRTVARVGIARNSAARVGRVGKSPSPWVLEDTCQAKRADAEGRATGHHHVSELIASVVHRLTFVECLQKGSAEHDKLFAVEQRPQQIL